MGKVALAAKRRIGGDKAVQGHLGGQGRWRGRAGDGQGGADREVDGKEFRSPRRVQKSGHLRRMD